MAWVRPEGKPLMFDQHKGSLPLKQSENYCAFDAFQIIVVLLGTLLYIEEVNLQTFLS